MTDAGWKPDPTTGLLRRLGDPPDKLGTSRGMSECPDIWELDNGDIAVVGRDLTESYAAALPDGLVIGAGERLVVIPRVTFRSAAKGDLHA